MTEQTKAVLKTYFQTGDFPTESQFGDLIDTFITETSAGNTSAPHQTIVSNITGVSAQPVNNTLTALFDNILGNSQGNIAYRSNSSWTVLAPGTNGQLLTTGGVSANPSWSTASGTGTVTSVSAGNGLIASPNPIVGAGSIQIKDIPAIRIMANTTGVSAAPVANTLSTVIDSAVSGTQGSILYRGAASWTILSPGTTGQVLTTSGVSANPTWSSSGGSSFVYLATKTASNSASLDFTSILSSTYDDYVFILDAILPASNSQLLFRTSSNNSTFDSGSGNYKWNYLSLDNTAAPANKSSASATSIELAGSNTNAIGTAAASAVSGTLRLYSVNNTVANKRLTHELAYEDSNPSMQYVTGQGFRAATTAVNAVQFLMAAGNITSGSIKCYGVTKS